MMCFYVGADVEQKTSTLRRTALILASDQGHLDVVNVLIAAGKKNRKVLCPCKHVYAVFEANVIP